MNLVTVRSTYFADPRRATVELIERQHRLVSSNPLVVALLDSFPEPAAIVNRERQIVLANDKIARLAGTTPAKLLGQRMGEAIGCEYAHEPPAGCGTTPACEFCGAARAIDFTQRRKEPTQKDCHITLLADRGQEALDFGVWTTPVDVEGESFTVFAVKDTSAEQRRRVLERMFFHDVLNSAGGLHNLLQLLPIIPPEEVADLTQSASRLAGQVVEEIQAQRDLAAAERGELTPRPVETSAVDLLQELCSVYQHHSVAEDRVIALDIDGPTPTLRTDPALLRRVLGNLVKNALEASRAGETVTVSYRHNGRPVFRVHNNGVMEEAVKLQIFRRSFSTKHGLGRGVGTYSARLLTERYLGGALRFVSEEGHGTTFTVTLPDLIGTDAR